MLTYYSSLCTLEVAQLKSPLQVAAVLPSPIKMCPAISEFETETYLRHKEFNFTHAGACQLTRPNTPFAHFVIQTVMSGYSENISDLQRGEQLSLGEIHIMHLPSNRY
jgi:hypothetical protein